MSRADRNEWIEQAKDELLANEKVADSVTRELIFLYDEAASQIEDNINSLFGKYVADNGLSITQANQLLSGKEYSVWKKSIGEYLAQIKNSPADSKTLLELNTLAMKGRISRQEQMLSNVYRNMADLAGKSAERLDKMLGDILKTSFYRTTYNAQKSVSLAFGVPKIDEALVRQVLDYPWSQKQFSIAVWDNIDKLTAVAKREIAMGIINGSGSRTIAKNIDTVMEKGKYVAERLARTETHYFTNQGRLLSWKENGVKKYKFIGAEKHGEHCSCGSLNGQIFDIDKAQAWINYPPLHPNCKCTVIAYFENGIFNDKSTEPFDNDMTLSAWKKKYVKENEKINTITLSDSEESAVYQYISSDSYKINDKLRRNAKLNRDEKKFVADLDSALDKMPEYKGTLYRSLSDFGIDNVDEFIKSHKEGDIFTSMSYLSTSANVYDDSFPIQYVIKSKHGKDIMSYNENEKEILFKRNTSFLITKIDGNTINMEER